MGSRRKRSHKGSSGSVRGLSCPNSTTFVSALGVEQKGESQKFLFCGHYLRGRMDRKRTAQREVKEKEGCRCRSEICTTKEQPELAWVSRVKPQSQSNCRVHCH